MKRMAMALTAALALSAASELCEASKLNPCLRVLTYSPTEKVMDAEPIKPSNPCPFAPAQLKSAVHEHVTNFTLQAYRQQAAFSRTGGKFNYVVEPAWFKLDGKFHRTIAIMHGVWWNDDPLMYLQGESGDFRQGLLHFATIFSKKKRHWYEGGVADCKVRREDHLAVASHYGRLQHLHFMTNLPDNSSREQALSEVTEDALGWIKFAFEVATGRRSADSRFTEEDEQRLKLPSISKNLCLREASNAKIRSIFTRQGPATPLFLKQRNALTPDVATGSMLHVIQDSFSAAHACRVEVQEGGSTNALLARVYNYNDQDSEAHSLQDDYPDWLIEYAHTGKHRFDNDPIFVGAWLIDAVDRQKEWRDVESYLRSTVFKQASTESQSTLKCLKP